MWGTVVMLGFLAALDPVRLAVILLMISRRKPVQNLIAYAAGCLAACSYMLVLPLAVLNSTPISSYAQNPATSSTMRHIQIGVGALALLLAAVMMVRFTVRRPTLDNPVIRRLGGRARRMWDTGGWWIALVLGVGTGGPPWGVVALLLAVVVLSGAAVGAQVAAAIVFVAGMLAVVEIILISYLINPVKAQAVLQGLRDWVWVHRRRVVAAATAVAGASLIATGIMG